MSNDANVLKFTDATRVTCSLIDRRGTVNHVIIIDVIVSFI